MHEAGYPVGSHCGCRARFYNSPIRPRPEMPMTLPRTLFRLLFGRRLPVTSGTLRIAGVGGRVRIDRDSWGIPHIDAQNEHDAWFGLGFCQGQDRAFQLETILRVSRGTVAEMVGAKGLPIDRV